MWLNYKTKTSKKNVVAIVIPHFGVFSISYLWLVSVVVLFHKIKNTVQKFIEHIFAESGEVLVNYILGCNNSCF